MTAFKNASHEFTCSARVLAFTLIATFVSTTALATSINPNRCETKITQTVLADGRNTWGARCIHPGPHSVDPNEYASVTSTIPVLNSIADTNHQKHWYMSVYESSGSPLDLPDSANAPCVPITDPYNHVSICQSGCFRGDQLVLFNDGYHPLATMADGTSLDLVTLAEGSTLESLGSVQK